MSYVKPGETVEDLNLQGLRIIQKEKGFRFGVDAVLLSDFVVERSALFAASLLIVILI